MDLRLKNGPPLGPPTAVSSGVTRGQGKRGENENRQDRLFRQPLRAELVVFKFALSSAQRIEKEAVAAAGEHVIAHHHEKRWHTTALPIGLVACHTQGTSTGGRMA